MPSIAGRMARLISRGSALVTVSWFFPHQYQRWSFNLASPYGCLKARGVEFEPLNASGVPVEWLIPRGCAGDRVILYLHGGGYVVGSIRSHRNMVSRFAVSAGCRVLMVNYRLAPEHPYPAALEDALASYRWLLQQGYAAEKIVLAGESAGGGLAVAVMTSLRDAGEPLPAGAVLMSPWVDLAVEGDSVRTVGLRDPMVSGRGLRRWAKSYLRGTDPRTPLASPLYADLRGLPPLHVQVGTAEVLLDDARRFCDKARDAGVRVELGVYDGMFHVWHFFAPFVPESNQAIRKLGEFTRDRMNVRA